MENWLEYGKNREYVQRLRTLLSENDTPVFIFLGAGLSFGVDRGRVMFERDEFESIDNRRFPSWPQLVQRMQKSLLSDPLLEPFKDSLNHFFEVESALDCAELFRNYNQGPN